MSDSIIRDPITLERFLELNYAASCEDCTHFDGVEAQCTFHFPTSPFRRENQLNDVRERGQAAFCRVIEID